MCELIHECVLIACLPIVLGDVNGKSASGKVSEPRDVVKIYAKDGLQLKLENPEESYSFKEEIGRGKFAVVKRCQDNKTKKTYAAKLVKYDEEDRTEALQEFDVHRSLKSDKVVELRDAFLVRNYIVLIMDVLDGKDALSYLASKSRASEEDAAFVVRQVLEALKYLHGQNIVHLDIRPANIIVQASAIKLIDFGNARKLKNKEGEVGAVVGNPEFTAPEVLSFEPVNMAADMWSVGIMTYLMVSALLPFTGEDEDAVEQAVKERRCSFADKAFRSITDSAKKFIEKLLHKAPGKRLDVTSAASHDWLSIINARRRKMSDIPTAKLKEINEQLIVEEEDQLIAASCMLRTFDEEEYDSPESEEEEDDN